MRNLNQILNSINGNLISSCSFPLSDILQGYEAIERGDTLSAQLDALADLKFTHVVSCQLFGSQKTSGDPQAQEIIDLMIRYPSLRVAYVEEREQMMGNKPIYSSVLVKAVNGFDQVLVFTI